MVINWNELKEVSLNFIDRFCAWTILPYFQSLGEILTIHRANLSLNTGYVGKHDKNLGFFSPPNFSVSTNLFIHTIFLILHLDFFFTLHFKSASYCAEFLWFFHNLSFQFYCGSSACFSHLVFVWSCSAWMHLPVTPVGTSATDIPVLPSAGPFSPGNGTFHYDILIGLGWHFQLYWF